MVMSVYGQCCHPQTPTPLYILRGWGLGDEIRQESSDGFGIVLGRQVFYSFVGSAAVGIMIEVDGSASLDDGFTWGGGGSRGSRGVEKLLLGSQRGCQKP